MMIHALQTVMLIKQLNLCDDINNLILLQYKYQMLEPKYKRRHDNMVKYLQYYIWLNKKGNRRDNLNVSIIKTIKEFDYY